MKKNFENEYCPNEVRTYKSKKAKNAQEAHEGIRPTDIELTPDQVSKYLDTDSLKLYSLIWKRALASQMSSAVFERTAIDISSEKNELKLRANGSVVKFDGFLNIYSEFKAKSDEQIKKDENEEDEDEVTLPAISKGMKIN